MAPYEALYERPCKSSLCWTEVGESSITGPDLIRDTSEKVSLIRQRLLTAQSRQKSYADVRRQPLEFEVGDHVFLKVMPKRGVVKFGKRGKLSPKFIRPFEILERDRRCSVPIGVTAQHVRCPRGISRLHAPEIIFQIQLMWLIGGQIEVDTDGTFEERPVCILDSRDQVLRHKTVRLVFGAMASL